MRKGGTMSDTEIDHILSKQDELLPSSGFVSSVMDAVRAEATAPPPIPFPWRRALPFMVVAAVVLVGLVIVGIAGIAELASAPSSTAIASQSSLLSLFRHGGVDSVTAWTVGALLLAFLSAKFSMRIAMGRS